MQMPGILKVEYRVVSLTQQASDREFEKELNRLGADGYEVRGVARGVDCVGALDGYDVVILSRACGVIPMPGCGIVGGAS